MYTPLYKKDENHCLTNAFYLFRIFFLKYLKCFICFVNIRVRVFNHSEYLFFHRISVNGSKYWYEINEHVNIFGKQKYVYKNY